MSFNQAPVPPEALSSWLPGSQEILDGQPLRDPSQLRILLTFFGNIVHNRIAVNGSTILVLMTYNHTYTF